MQNDLRAHIPLEQLGLSAVLVGTLVLTLSNPAMTLTDVIVSRGQGTAIRQVAYFALLGMSLVSIKAWSKPWRLNVVPAPIFAFFMWAALSITWSPSPTFSLKRLTLTVVVILLIFLTTTRLGHRRATAIARYILIIALVINYAVTLLMPSVGLMLYHVRFSPEEWQGIMGHKNYAGFLAAVTLIFFLFDARQLNLVLRVVVILASLVFLMLSDARTSMVSLIAALASGGVIALWAKPIARWLDTAGSLPSRIGIALACGFALGLTYLTVDETFLLGLTQDETALSRRTEIWRGMLDYYFAHPLTGAGFGAFWAEANTAGASSNGNWLNSISHAHNGYLDTAVGVGLPGLQLALFAAVVWPLWKTAKRLERARTSLVMALLTLCLVCNLGESGLFDRDQLSQVFLMFALALIKAPSSKMLRQRVRATSSKSFKITAQKERGSSVQSV